MIYDENFPPIKRKTSLDSSTSMGEIDGLSLIFVDLYVPALESGLHRSEAALQFLVNITFFAIVA
jgi:hypothetical protein